MDGGRNLVLLDAHHALMRLKVDEARAHAPRPPRVGDEVSIAGGDIDEILEFRLTRVDLDHDHGEYILYCGPLDGE